MAGKLKSLWSCSLALPLMLQMCPIEFSKEVLKKELYLNSSARGTLIKAGPSEWWWRSFNPHYMIKILGYFATLSWCNYLSRVGKKITENILSLLKGWWLTASGWGWKWSQPDDLIINNKVWFKKRLYHSAVTFLLPFMIHICVISSFAFLDR